MFVLVAIVLVILLAALANRDKNNTGRNAVTPAAPAGGPLQVVLDHAVAARIITAEQAGAIVAHEQARVVAGRAPEPAHGRRAGASTVVEAVGYLGAILVAVGALALISRWWDDLATWSRMSILGSTALALTGAGWWISERDAVLWRLRGVVLLLASAAVAGFAGVLGADALDLAEAPTTALVGAAIAVHAGGLWARRNRPAQHVAALAGLVTAVAGTASWAGMSSGALGLVLWVLGGFWLACALRALLPPPVVGLTAGAILVLAAAGVVAGEWRHAGTIFGLLSAAGLMGLGIRTDEFVVTGVGVIGTLIYLPRLLTLYFADTAGVPLAMVTLGLGLLALMSWLMRRGGASGRPPTRPHVSGHTP